MVAKGETCYVNDIVGFTASERGMRPVQKENVQRWLTHFFKLGFRRFWFGDCVGGDFEAFEYADAIGYETHALPSTIKDKRAFAKATIIDDPADPLKRNDVIAHTCGVLLAAPGTINEVLRSGEWATIRYARKYEKPIFSVLPNGHLLKENVKRGFKIT